MNIIIYFNFLIILQKPKQFDVKPSALPAIELPHPGTSYNPSYDDHQDLLLDAHVVELEKLKKEERRIRNLDSKIPKMTYSEIENLWLKEMSSDLVNMSSNEEDVSSLGNDSNIQEVKNEKKMSKKQKTKVQKKRSELIEKLKVKTRRV